MVYVKSTEMDESRVLARLMCFSNETIGRLCESASAGQVRGYGGVIEDNLVVRSRRKKEQSLEKAKLPAVKTFEGYDFSRRSPQTAAERRASCHSPS